MLDVYAKIKVFIHSGKIRKSVMISKEKVWKKNNEKNADFFVYISLYIFC